MYPSYVFGRVGGLDETTGLFVLEGGLSAYDISRDIIATVASSRDGYEVGSKIPFQDGQGNPGVQFLNQLPRYSTTDGAFGLDIQESIAQVEDSDGETAMLSYADDSIIFNTETRKIAAKRYVNEFIGIVPRNRVIKTILRQKDIATKRIILFGSSTDPVDGGGLWLVSPHGFPWKDTPKYILDEGTPDDLEQAMEDKNFLFLAMTGAVPFISGHRQRQPDEEFPRILRIPSVNPQYLTLLEARLADQILDSAATGVRPQELSKANLGFVRSLFHQAQKNGKVSPKPKDLLGDEAFSLSDVDVLL